VTINHRGTKVFFTGGRFIAAFDLRSTERIWRSRFDGDGTIAMAVVPSSPPQVVVTGYIEIDQVYAWDTAAYDTRTGRALWSDVYRGPLRQQGFPRDLTAAPAGTRVYVVGYASTRRSDDFATIAYRTT
jgi:outer membrane protein assembly factor BamB